MAKKIKHFYWHTNVHSNTRTKKQKQKTSSFLIPSIAEKGKTAF